MARFTTIACAAALLLCAVAAVQAQKTGATVTIQFDNTLDRVKGNDKVVSKYVGEKLCRIGGPAIFVKGTNDGNVVNHKSTVTFFCPGVPANIIAACNGMWNRHQVKDEIKDHTTPDIEVQKVLACGPAGSFANGAVLPAATKPATRPAGH